MTADRQRRLRLSDGRALLTPPSVCAHPSSLIGCGRTRLSPLRVLTDRTALRP
ncbi:hypothetical protein K523DRAFT_325879 [Schizophyllum commune Tattone D]|nr:hypothetical protein K523DRAFT_325879 [Schizophyllum commune Tattone D]